LDRSSGSQPPGAFELSCGGLVHSVKEMVKFSSRGCTEMIPETCLTSAVEPDERGIGRSCEASNLDGKDQ